MRERVRNKHEQAQGIVLTELAAVLREHSERSRSARSDERHSSTHTRCEQHLGRFSRKGRGGATTHVARLAAAAATAAAAAAAARLRVRAVAGDVSCKNTRLSV